MSDPNGVQMQGPTTTGLPVAPGRLVHNSNRSMVIRMMVQTKHCYQIDTYGLEYVLWEKIVD